MDDEDVDEGRRRRVRSVFLVGWRRRGEQKNGLCDSLKKKKNRLLLYFFLIDRALGVVDRYIYL
jgi:hypothetical protein